MTTRRKITPLDIDDDQIVDSPAPPDPEEPGTVTDEITEYLAKYDLLDAGFLCSVYKFPLDSRERKELCFQYRDEIPTEHKIGVTFGSGNFQVLISGKDEKNKTFVFKKNIRLNQVYDRLQAEAQAPAPPSTALAVPAQTGDLSQAIAVIREVMSIILPVIQSQTTRNAAQQPNQDIFGAYKMFNEAMKQNVLDNTAFFNDVQRKIGSLPTDSDEAEPEPGFIQTVIPLLEKFIPMLLNKRSASATLNSFQHLPAVADVLQDPQKLRQIIAEIDKRKGKAIGNKLRETLKSHNINV